MTRGTLHAFERRQHLEPLSLADWSYHRRSRRPSIPAKVADALIIGALVIGAVSGLLIAAAALVGLIWIVLALGRAVAGGLS